MIEPSKEKELSRPQKREHKKINMTLRTLVIAFLEFRLQQSDKEGSIVALKFSILEKKWMHVCHNKFKYFRPDKLAFSKRVAEILAKENKENKITLA